MALTILEGSTFCVCDERGDIDGPMMGLFAADTRFLSRCVLTINGARPRLLTGDKPDYYSAAFFLANPTVDDLRTSEVAIRRERFVGEGMQDHLVVENHGRRRVAFELALDLGNDFADIFAVKSYDPDLGIHLPRRPLVSPPPPQYDETVNQLLFSETDGFEGRTQVLLSQRGEVEGGTVRYRIELDPHERWELRMDVITVLDDAELERFADVERHFGEERARVQDSFATWNLRVPRLRTSWDELAHGYRRSVADLAALRMRGTQVSLGELPAAGMPWFMTVFGRDTLITCLQTLMFGPELARTALRVLAELQATEDDPAIDAEPGKIIHEVRRGKAAAVWTPRYYGTLDATPLFLILLSAVWRWTDDAGFVRELRGPAMRALAWIDEYGDRDGDGFVEYLRRSPTGIRNQSWKDSDESQVFRDGSYAEPPIAPVEVQGYVYDAKLRTAELAREVWRDRDTAERLERDATALRERFDAAFWCGDEGGYYALALDRDKRRVDGLASNMGHLLWSGIVPPARVDAVVDHLMADELWSGWGVRTLAADQAGYNPLGYHNGTVWPHDNSLIAWGLARYGRWNEALRIVRRTIEAAAHFGYQLPEVFAGFASRETPFPVAYPTATRPQAWAAAAPILLLQVLLGLEPNRVDQLLESHAPRLPSWTGTVKLSGIRAFDRPWDVQVDGGQVLVEEA